MSDEEDPMPPTDPRPDDDTEQLNVPGLVSAYRKGFTLPFSDADKDELNEQAMTGLVPPTDPTAALLDAIRAYGDARADVAYGRATRKAIDLAWDTVLTVAHIPPMDARVTSQADDPSGLDVKAHNPDGWCECDDCIGYMADEHGVTPESVRADLDNLRPPWEAMAKAIDDSGGPVERWEIMRRHRPIIEAAIRAEGLDYTPDENVAHQLAHPRALRESPDGK